MKWSTHRSLHWDSAALQQEETELCPTFALPWNCWCAYTYCWLYLGPSDCSPVVDYQVEICPEVLHIFTWWIQEILEASCPVLEKESLCCREPILLSKQLEGVQKSNTHSGHQVIIRAPVILIQYLDVQCLWDTVSLLIMSFNLEETQHALEDSVFTFRGRKKDYFMPYQLKYCISNHRQNWGTMNLKAPYQCYNTRLFPFSMYLH